MFAKVFASLWQGSMVGQADAQLVFIYLLAHCDSEGFVEHVQDAIAHATGLSVDRVKAALAVLEAPDPQSRSAEEQGRRIVRLDEHRDWGWWVVNFARYRALRDEEIRREQNREAKRRQRSRANGDMLTGADPRLTVADIGECQPPSAHSRRQMADAEGEATSKSGTEPLSGPVQAASPVPGPELLLSTQSGQGGAPAARGVPRSGERESDGPLSLPVVGGGWWAPATPELEAWGLAYPGVDIPAQLRRMRAWLLSNPRLGKTRRGMPRFVNNWLAGSQDGTGGGRSGRPGSRSGADGRYLEHNRAGSGGGK